MTVEGGLNRDDFVIREGAWEGEYIDVNGFRGRLDFTLDVTEKSFDGRYKLTLRAEDEPHILTGELKGEVRKGQVYMLLTLGDSEEKMNFKAQLCHAGSYAEQALFGMVEPMPQHNLGGGVWIAWRFRGNSDGR